MQNLYCLHIKHYTYGSLSKICLVKIFCPCMSCLGYRLHCPIFTLIIISVNHFTYPERFCFQMSMGVLLEKKKKNRRTTMVIKNIAPKRKRKQFLLELSTNFAFAFWNWQTEKISLALEMEKIKSFVDWNWKMNFFARQKWNRFC